MVCVHSPSNEVELRLLCSLLDWEGIVYFIHNDHFGTLRIGPRIDLLNAKTILVSHLDAARARELIDGYLRSTASFRWTPKADKLRMIIETLVFGWFVPGARRRF